MPRGVVGGIGGWGRTEQAGVGEIILSKLDKKFLEGIVY
jgi:hypothetical protein